MRLSGPLAPARWASHISARQAGPTVDSTGSRSLPRHASRPAPSSNPGTKARRLYSSSPYGRGMPRRLERHIASVVLLEASAAIALGSSSRGGQLTYSPRTWLRTLTLNASYPTPPNGSQRLREEEERGMIHPRHSIHIKTHWENTAGA